jgi:TonB family protein
MTLASTSMDAVTSILAERAQARRGLWPRLGLSVLLHAAVLPIVMIWMAASAPEDPAARVVMSVSLAGAPGARSGGMTQMSARAAEAAPPTTKPAPVAPPAAKAPEMALPKADTRKTPPRETPKQAPDDAKGRTTPKAAQATQGSAVAETGVKTGAAFGISTGGTGGTTGYLDVANFCCPEYLATMIQLIQRNWSAKQQVAGDTLMKYTIQRDGRLTNVEIEKTSGYFALDQTAQRALLVTRQLPPLPPQFTENTLTVHLIFRYER